MRSGQRLDPDIVACHPRHTSPHVPCCSICAVRKTMFVVFLRAICSIELLSPMVAWRFPNWMKYSSTRSVHLWEAVLMNLSVDTLLPTSCCENSICSVDWGARSSVVFNILVPQCHRLGLQLKSTHHAQDTITWFFADTTHRAYTSAWCSQLTIEGHMLICCMACTSNTLCDDRFQRNPSGPTESTVHHLVSTQSAVLQLTGSSGNRLCSGSGCIGNRSLRCWTPRPRISIQAVELHRSLRLSSPWQRRAVLHHIGAYVGIL
ncbi:hypothetical protein B0H21DRAFT_339434 [Amylocystis lapponica]|nr:hypothetical protein B0H21DRAFT_339434 [Amylocystis lapponica]